MTCHCRARVTSVGDAMDGQWVTYRDLAVRLGVSVEAARRRALRGKWRRMPSNNGVTLVMPPDDLSVTRAPDVRLTSAPDTSALVTALQNHIKTLQEDTEALKKQLATERTGFAAREAALAGDLATERARTEKAIEAFASLAERLDALAAERSRPWWRRLVG